MRAFAVNDNVYVGSGARYAIGANTLELGPFCLARRDARRLVRVVLFSARCLPDRLMLCL